LIIYIINILIKNVDYDEKQILNFVVRPAASGGLDK